MEDNQILQLCQSLEDMFPPDMVWAWLIHWGNKTQQGRRPHTLLHLDWG
jgi:hypothetical protein